MPVHNFLSEDENLWSEDEDILSCADPALLTAIEEDRLSLDKKGCRGTAVFNYFESRQAKSVFRKSYRKFL